MPVAPAGTGAPPRGLRRSRPPLIRHLARHRRRARAVGGEGDWRCRHQGEDEGRPRVRDACAWGEGGKVKSLNSGEGLLRVVQAGERNTSRQKELPTGQSRLGDRFPTLRESPASPPVQRRPHHPYALDGRAGACSCYGIKSLERVPGSPSELPAQRSSGNGLLATFGEPPRRVPSKAPGAPSDDG